MAVSFDTLTERLKEVTKDPSLFDFGDFNALKIVQHAIHSSAAQAVVTQRPFFLIPGRLQSLIYQIRAWRNKAQVDSKITRLRRLPQRDVILYSGANTVRTPEGKIVSSNTFKLLKTFDRERLLYIYNQSKREAISDGQDLNSSEIPGSGSYLSMNQADRRMSRSLAQMYFRVKAKKVLNESELHHFKAHLQNFFDAYRDWSRLLEQIKSRVVYFYPHYHNEGLIAACREVGIRSIELQHGLISREDFYYVYPSEFTSFIDRALFADRILVFGTFWKDELLLGAGYKASQIEVIGRYQYHPPTPPEITDDLRKRYHFEDKKIIAIACQTNQPEYFAEYTCKLSVKLAAENPDYLIVLKPHPRQARLEVLQACSDLTNVRVLDKSENLMALLQLSEIQISVYSTTFFDAIGTNTVNLSLQGNATRSGYSKSMVDIGIALPLNEDDNPVKVVSTALQAQGPELETVFAAFNPQVLDK